MKKADVKNALFASRVLPKMMVLIIDIMIMSLSFLLSFLIVPPAWFNSIFNKSFLKYIAIYIILSGIVFYLLKIPKNVMRFSNIPDLYRIFVAVFTTGFVFDILVKLMFAASQSITFGHQLLLVNFALSSTALVMLRIGVKGIFAHLKKRPENRKDVVVIYGADKGSIIIKHAIEANGKFYVVGFLDDSAQKANKYIEQRYIFNINTLLAAKDRLNIKTLVITEEDLGVSAKKTVIERCIDNGISIVKVARSADLTNKSLKVGQLKNLSINDLLQRDPIVIDTQNILMQLSNKRILITGASGSIGSEIVRQALTFHPAIVVLCDNAESPLHELQMELEDAHSGFMMKPIIVNVQNLNRMREVFIKYKPEIVFHAAAYKHVPLMEHNPAEAVLTNVFGTKHTADLSIQYGVEKFLMISTDKAINPTNVMGATKRIAELYVQSLNRSDCSTKFIVTRFGNVLGSNGSVVTRFKSQIELGRAVTVTHPDITRYFMTIKEAVQLVMEACAIGQGGQVLLFDMGMPVKIFDLAQKMIRMSGLVPGEDIEIIFSGLRPGEKLYEELLYDYELSVASHHPKIRISCSPNQQHNIAASIAELEDLINGNDLDIVKKIKEAVPEFISNNSMYEILDVKATSA
ncbi:hypothetical protein A0256_13380 [Mucilaginibacter sp. PAMC 26640]|nr:hypothetical protein A0256_13380 [Mucilaginibacter sp. PAMC 26640]